MTDPKEPAYLAEHRIKPEWHREASSITNGILGWYEWQSKEDQRASMLTRIACAIRDFVEADRALRPSSPKPEPRADGVELFYRPDASVKHYYERNTAAEAVIAKGRELQLELKRRGTVHQEVAKLAVEFDDLWAALDQQGRGKDG